MEVRGILAAVVLLASLPLTAQQETPSQPASQSYPESTASPASIPDLTPGTDGKLSQEQMQQLLRVVAEKDIDNDKRQRDYTYIEREVQKNFDGKGHVKSTEIKTYEILDIAGEQVERLIQKDDKPLESKEAAKEDEKIQKIIDKRKNETDEQRRKREEKDQKEREDGRKFVKEIADAYNFKLVGTELVGGREAWVIDGEPRPGFEPHMKDAKFLSKIHGRVWIDKSDLQLSKLDVEMLDTISFGLVIARLHKGTRFSLEQTRVNDEVWLPRRVQAFASARLGLLKVLRMEQEISYANWGESQTDSPVMSQAKGW